jgi:acrylyl-CoA reductase (NADPH)
VTGRPETQEYLRGLGATAFLTREEMSEPPRPLESETWAGAVDTVGSTMLAKVLAQMKFRSTVAACGLAGGADLPTTVMPFIIRAVRLQGVEAVMAPIPMREAAWARLETDLPADVVDAITEVVPLSEGCSTAARRSSTVRSAAAGSSTRTPERSSGVRPQM